MTIRACLIAAAACLCLAGCNTPSSEEGGVLSSLGVPMLQERSCSDVSAEAVALSARAFTSVGIPASPPREGPDGMTVVPWPDIPGDDGLSAERAAIRARAEAAHCSIAFRVNRPVDVEANVPVQPTLPVDVTPLGEPAPVTVDAVAARPPAAEPEARRPRSAWDDEPRPVGMEGARGGGVDGINPAVAPPPPKPVAEAAPAQERGARAQRKASGPRDSGRDSPRPRPTGQ